MQAGRIFIVDDRNTCAVFQEQHPSFNFRFARLKVDYLEAFVIKLPTTMLITSDSELLYEEEGYRVWTQYNNLEKVKEIAD